MKKLGFLLFLILVFASVGFSQTVPAFLESCTLDATNSSCTLRTEEGLGIGAHVLSWTTQGTNSGSTGLLQYSDNNTTFTTLITGTTTASGESANTTGTHRYWKFTLSNFTATSQGASVTLVHKAYNFTPGTASIGSVTIDQSTPGTTNGIVCNSGCSGGTQYTQDAALTIGTTVGTMSMGRASAAKPTDVSADGDAVIPWYLLSGAQVVQLTNAGVLTASGSGTATAALRVELPTNGTGVIATVGAVTAITNALPAGSNVIGHVIVDSGGGGGSTAQGASTSGVTGGLSMGSVTTGNPTYTTATVNGLSLDTSGGLRVDCITGCSGGTSDTDDASIATGQTVGLSGAEQMVYDGSVWRRQTIGTAGTASAQVTTIQGITSMTPVIVTSSVSDAAENAAVTSNPVPIGGVYRSSPVTLDSGDVGYPLLDVNGRLIVNCNTGCSGGTQYTQDAALTVGSSVVTLAGGRASAAAPTDVSADNDAVMPWYLRSGAQVVQPTFGGVLASAGNGASGTGVQRVTIANDSTGIIGLAAGSALAGEFVPVTTATTTDTALRCFVLVTASTNSTGCKGSAGNVYGFRFVNTTATTYYLRMYNLSSPPTCSSNTGYVETIPLLATGGIVSIEPMGEGYSTGIGLCVTGGGANNDNTNAAAGVWGNVLYK